MDAPLTTDLFEQYSKEIKTSNQMVKSLYEAFQRFMAVAQVPLTYSPIYDYCLGSSTKFRREEELVAKLNSASAKLEQDLKSKKEDERVANVVRRILHEIVADEIKSVAEELSAKKVK